MFSHLVGYHGYPDHCCTPNEKEPILRKAREHRWPTDHQSTSNSSGRFPEHDPHWNYEDCVVQALDEILYYLPIRRNEKVYGEACKIYDKVREVTQDKDENPQSFWVGDRGLKQYRP